MIPQENVYVFSVLVLRGMNEDAIRMYKLFFSQKMYLKFILRHFPTCLKVLNLYEMNHNLNDKGVSYTYQNLISILLFCLICVVV